MLLPKTNTLDQTSSCLIANSVIMTKKLYFYMAAVFFTIFQFFHQFIKNPFRYNLGNYFTKNKTKKSISFDTPKKCNKRFAA